jgi:hypothetical protein
MRRLSALSALFCAALVPRLSAQASADAVSILEDKCVKCHGAALQLGKLDLRTRDAALKGGEHGPAIVPGKAEESRLFRHVTGVEKPQMPMDGKLSPEQIASIQHWIDEGAHWQGMASAGQAGGASKQLAGLEEMTITDEARRWWAFQPPVRPRVPANSARHPVDAFLQDAMEKRGIEAGPEADRRTLVRRAYLDLIGLPPSPAEVREFLDDVSPRAWERLIEKLLASQHYGERWGRHWLDVARYADSNGYEHDFNRPNAWRYRDYVIRSFNKDTPYNVFLHEQIAGDELDWVTYDTLIATGFLRNYAKVGFREKDNPQYRYEYLDDMIATLGRGVLGMTVQCARCHNHKFDPIPQKDYYRIQASLFGYVEVQHPLVPREEAEAYEKAVADVEARTRPLKEKVRALERPYRERLLPAKYKKFPQNIQDAIATPEEKRTPGQVLLANQIIRTVSLSPAEIERVMTPDDLALKKSLLNELREIEKLRPEPIPVAMGITDGDYRFAPDGPGDEPAPGKGVKREAIEGSFLHKGEGHYAPPPSYFLISGDIESRGSLMKPGFLTVAGGADMPVEIPPAHGRTSGRRRALAEWLTSAQNPLTARVMVNRIWHHHFGRGIVGTLDNFGKMGERPSHPQLLDWLAVEFMTRGWSVKQMHRLIMTSDAYRRASQFENAANAGKDPDNALLWRFRLQRLDAEIIRDAILTVSGGLNREMFGEPVFPELQPEVLASMDKGVWEKKEDGPEVWRRSVYVYRKRGLPFPMFEVFDLPDQNVSCGRRNVSTVPTQALTLLNNEFVLGQAALFANRLREAAPGDAARQAELAFEIALGRPPEDDERAALAGRPIDDVAHVLFNLNEFVYMR